MMEPQALDLARAVRDAPTPLARDAGRAGDPCEYLAADPPREVLEDLAAVAPGPRRVTCGPGACPRGNDL